MRWRDHLAEFVSESNRIEGILHTRDEEVDATRQFIEQDRVDRDAVVRLADVLTDGEGLLRQRPGMNVRVGAHRPPAGSALIPIHLDTIVMRAATGDDPYHIHVSFETLHPFMDGNGRSGRALWAWQMVHQQRYDLSIGFLHMWYYQSLQHAR